MTTLRRFVDGLAEVLGVEAEARKKWWQRRGVPLRWRRPIIAMAGEQGVLIEWDELEKGPSLDGPLTVQNVPQNARAFPSSREFA